jgi:hypothetical protein
VNEFPDKTAYDNCDFTQATPLAQTSGFIWTPDQAGDFYFGCSIPGHCQPPNNMKLAIHIKPAAAGGGSSPTGNNGTTNGTAGSSPTNNNGTSGGGGGGGGAGGAGGSGGGGGSSNNGPSNNNTNITVPVPAGFRAGPYNRNVSVVTQNDTSLEVNEACLQQDFNDAIDYTFSCGNEGLKLNLIYMQFNTSWV